MIKAYHEDREDFERDTVLVPDSAHGTNLASAAMTGYKVIEVPSDARGLVDLDALRLLANERTAAFMLTNPNTLGLFEEQILEISELIHSVGGLCYYDGANLNAIMGKARPGDMGMDVVHINLHKTFSTPHGGGGPGAGPVAVGAALEPYLPVPLVERRDDGFALDHDRPKSIGRLRSFYGNAGIFVRAFTYALRMGADGLTQASEDAVLNANYLRVLLHDRYKVPFDRLCMHEFVISATLQSSKGAGAGAIGKRILDFGVHAPTVYFPLIVPEALMIEPTETESKATLDQFVDIMNQVDDELNADADIVCKAPHTTPVRQPDGVEAARRPILRWISKSALDANIS
jgi:glycine dehydrogenase subunit 2